MTESQGRNILEYSNDDNNNNNDISFNISSIWINTFKISTTVRDVWFPQLQNRGRDCGNCYFFPAITEIGKEKEIDSETVRQQLYLMWRQQLLKGESISKT